MVRKKILVYNLFTFFILYLNIVLTFALFYLLLDALGLGRIIDHFSPIPQPTAFLDRLFHSVYFSAITLLAVGYGDLTPFGYSRAVAVLEAMIGYILPAALVIGYSILPSRSLFKTIMKKKGQT